MYGTTAPGLSTDSGNLKDFEVLSNDFRSFRCHELRPQRGVQNSTREMTSNSFDHRQIF